MKKFIYTCLVLFIINGCGTTASIEKSWRDPNVTVDVSKLNKVLVVALMKDETTRRTTEDQLVSLLKGKGVASYNNYLTRDLRQDGEERMHRRLREEGFDGIVIMRLADVEKDVRYVPGQYPPYYGRFWGYYWNAWNAFYDPGYYQTTKTYRVETNVYSLKRDKLIWSGITSSVDPANINKLMNAVARTVYQKMKKEGFIAGA